MADIVQRLRQEGEDAMRKHLSLGMHKLCEEAAGEIERLRVALTEAYEKLKIECSDWRPYQGGMPTQVLFPMIEAALHPDLKKGE